MKRNIMFVLSIISLLIALSACSSDSTTSEAEADNDETEEKKVIKAGATGQSFPNSIEEDGELTGFDVEVLEAVADELGYEVDWVTTAFDGLVAQLDTGKLDTIANVMQITDERVEKYEFSTPYSYVGSTILTHEDNDEINDLEDLKGKTVAAVADSMHAKNLENYDSDIDVRLYDNRDAAILDAVNERVDGYVNAKPGLIATVAKGDYPLKFVGKPFTSNGVGFPFLQDEKGAERAEEFSKAVDKLLDDGTIREISEKYFNGEDITVEE